MKLDQSMKIGIVGLGLIGGSYAQGLTAEGFKVGAVDVRRESVDFALENGWISDGRSSVDKDYIGQFDLIVFALYPKTFIRWIENYQQYLKPGTILTDVTGVKSGVVETVQKMLRPDLEFIAAHPMAGRESSGVENARKEVFYGANYIVIPTEKNTPEAVELCEDLGRVLHFKNISVLTPEKHDEMIAFLSQLTHCIAVSLMTCREAGHLAEYSGDSFRDLTRIAKINDEMWSELFLLNKEQLLGQMDLFEQAFCKLRQYIQADDRDAIREMMRNSTRQRVLFDKKGD
ncbi:MAG: prephenate dehydrogenase [Clostridia bacterium]|nr:prephenate dehydrogenase [Clostridia bacterium]